MLNYNFWFLLSQVLNLRNYFDIYEILTYPDKYLIKSQLQELVDSIQVPSIEIHVDDAITKLAQSGLKDFDIDKFTDNVSHKFVVAVFGFFHIILLKMPLFCAFSIDWSINKTAQRGNNKAWPHFNCTKTDWHRHKNIIKSRIQWY